MATIRNISPDALSLFASDAPTLDAGDTATVPDARFAGRAWPKSTWELVEPPVDYTDESTDDAYVFTTPDLAPVKAEKKPTTGGKA